jgi:hypothetical protein
VVVFRFCEYFAAFATIQQPESPVPSLLPYCAGVLPGTLAAGMSTLCYRGDLEKRSPQQWEELQVGLEGEDPPAQIS